MAKMYYTQEEAMIRLGITEDQLRGLIRDGKLREFRDAGKLNYRVDEVDRIATNALSGSGSGSGELSLEDSTQLTLSPADTGGPKAPGRSGSGSSGGSLSGSGSLPGLSGSSPGLGGSNAPIDLGGSTSGVLSLGGSSGSGLKLEDSKAGSSGELRLDDSKAGSSAGGADVLSLEEVDKEVLKSPKKDDTVITNIGISVFDDEDLEIAADPMAKTLMTGGDEHLGLDGSGGGSGLLDLTRESDDTSLGAELLEGIDMGDTAATVAQSVEVTQAAPGGEVEPEALETGPAGLEGPAVMTLPAGGYYVEAASPAFTGLLIAAAVVMALAGGMVVATTLNTWPSYLSMLVDENRFWFFLIGTFVLGGICAGIGYFVGQPRTPKPTKPVKEKVVKEKKAKEKKGKKAEA